MLLLTQPKPRSITKSHTPQGYVPVVNISHAGAGGGYKYGEQGKTQDMAFYAMQLMIDESSQYGIKFKPTPTEQLPSPEFTQLMNYYNRTQNNLQNNPTSQNQAYFNAISGLIKDIAVQDSTFKGTGKIENYLKGLEK